MASRRRRWQGRSRRKVRQRHGQGTKPEADHHARADTTHQNSDHGPVPRELASLPAPHMGAEIRSTVLISARAWG